MVEGDVTAYLDARCVLVRGRFSLDASLRIDAGETVAVLGPNGAGKSTLVEALAGLIALDAGRIRVDGDVWDDPEAGLFIGPEGRRVGVVFQDYLLFPHLTVAENVAFGLKARRWDRTEAKRLTTAWLERLDLTAFAHRYPSDLSGGQRQQVALARALAPSPDLLLLDEPLAAVDATTRIRLRRTLRDHLESFPGPRLLITHDPTDAFLLADRICVLEEGRITQTGTAEDIRLRPRTAYVADLVGVNFWVGQATEGTVVIGRHRLSIADRAIRGPVVVTLHPRAVSVHLRQPEGSPRNTWETTVERVESHGDRVRLRVGGPLPLTAEVTPAAIDDLRITSTSRVWVSIKATEIRAEPA